MATLHFFQQEQKMVLTVCGRDENFGNVVMKANNPPPIIFIASIKIYKGYF